MLGKRVLNNIYWHHSLTRQQPIEIQTIIYDAEELAQIRPFIDYNVIKYDSDSYNLSLLWYPYFFEAPFPALETSYRIDLTKRKVEKRSYQTSSNPPILHRKELLIDKDEPSYDLYKQLTDAAEQIGLFDDTVRIGYKQAWDSLIKEKGFKVVDFQFIPVGNNEFVSEFEIDSAENQNIARHLTALSRSNLSAPIQCLARYGFLDGSMTVFDYGCGKGDDIRNLSANAITVSGWDPHYAPAQSKLPADIVNLGFVINVIENYQERLEALISAYNLANQLLVVSAMLVNQNVLKGQAFEDGIVTKRNTFQKYYTQSELKDFLNESLAADAIPIAPGIFFVFKNQNLEQLFLFGRQRNKRNALRLRQRITRTKEPKLSHNQKKYLTYKHLIDPLWQKILELGRLPAKSELDSLIELTKAFSSINNAIRFTLDNNDETIYAQAQQTKFDDLVTYFALQAFTKRKAYKHLEAGLQKDIKAFFGDYQNAIDTATSILFKISNADLIAEACQNATERGLGFLDEGEALHLHTSIVQELPALLRIYIGCATILYGDIEQTDLIKIHIHSGKLSLMRYDDFDNQALPRLMERVKINLREQTFDLYEYGDTFEPTNLYLKSRYINEEFPNYAEQLNFDDQLQTLNLFELIGYGPTPEEFRQTLSRTRREIDGFNLIRSRTLPSIDEKCGNYLTYKQLIECGETQQATGIPNIPKQADSYNALYDLAANIIDPVIDYFGMIRLTYGFCSHELGKHIKKRVAPKVDQHAAHEVNTKKVLICPRLGAAIDFIVEDENMREVADWIAQNTDFDRLYFYGVDRPIHVSYGPEHKKEYVDLVITDSGRQIPRKRKLEYS